MSAAQAFAGAAFNSSFGGWNVNGTATARLAVREGDTVTLELQVLGGAAASEIPIPSIPIHTIYAVLPAALAVRCLPVLCCNRGTGWGS